VAESFSLLRGLSTGRIDRVIVVTITFDQAAQGRSYELLADAFGLGAMPRAA
jgi:hypothetical protein